MVSAQVLADAVLGLRAEPQTLAAFTGIVTSVQIITTAGVFTVGSASVRLQGMDVPIPVNCAGSFQAEAIAAAQANTNLIGKAALVLVVNSQPLALSTIGVGV